LHVGSHCSPGYLRDASGSREEVSSRSPCPFWTKPITHVGLSHMTTIQARVRVPTPMQLCWAGWPGGFRGTAFYARFTRLRVSRTRGAYASPRHLGERNCTSTAPKLSKTSAVSTPHPWPLCHFEGTDRSFALCPALPDALGGRDSTDYYGSAAPLLALATCPPTLSREPWRFRRCSHSNFSVSRRCPSVILQTCEQARKA
jgi:hypothetical protein